MDKRLPLKDFPKGKKLQSYFSKASGGHAITGKKINTRTDVKDWYCKTYKHDEMGQEINPKATWEGVAVFLDRGQDIYEYIHAQDSIVRERIMSHLAEMLGLDYDIVYYRWLGRI